MKRMESQDGLNRRDFVAGVSALAIANSMPAWAKRVSAPEKKPGTLAFIGTYTGAIGAGSNGEGIYSVRMDAESGELTGLKLAAKSPNPSWIAIHPSKKYLYAVNELTDGHNGAGSVSSFALDEASGELAALNVVSSEGAGPCYLTIDASGRFVFVANYGGGSIAVLPILDGGLLGPPTDIHQDTGSLGSTHATNGPPGSFAVSGHDATHAHMICPDPQDKHVLATDLGQDRIYSYEFDRTNGKLKPSVNPPFAMLPAGDGPRHFVFHPNAHWFYSIQEEASTIAFFLYDPAVGSLSLQQTISALPQGFSGTSFASEILIAPNGKHLYAANRLHDAVAIFSIGADGRLKWIAETSTVGDYPGQCRIDPSGKFFYSCNRRSDCITSFRIESESGRLTFTGKYTAVGSPASITFLG